MKLRFLEAISYTENSRLATNAILGSMQKIPITIFISSVQKELAEERMALKGYLSLKFALMPDVL